MNRKLAIGCGIALVLFAIGVGFLVVVVPKLIRKGVTTVKGVIAEEERIAAFEQAWTPPSASPDASWFPEQVGDWRRTIQGPSPGIPRLNIERSGQQAAYRFGAEIVEVNVVAASGLEKDGLFQRAQSASTGAARVTTKFGNRGSLRLNGNDYTRLWWMPKGWLFIFHNHGGTDPKEFMEPYLKAMEAAPAAEPPSPEAAPAGRPGE